MKNNKANPSSGGGLEKYNIRHGDRRGEVQNKKVSKCLEDNKNTLKATFDSGKNFDLVLRDFGVCLGGKEHSAFLIFFDGLSNKEFINRDILNPLMTRDLAELPEDKGLEDIIYRYMLTQAPNTKVFDMETVVDLVCFGNCAVFVDGCGCAFVADIKGWGTRGVGKPISEAVLTGPQEAFCETVMTNIALVRKILKDPNLVAENIPVGTKSKTPCALMYINGITNVALVREAKRRLLEIDTEYIFSSTDIEMLIEDSTLFPLPQLIKTERPDRAAAQLSDGKVIIIVQGSPFVLILPATVRDLAEVSEDSYVRTAEANFMRLVRLIGCFLAIFLPGAFISTVLFHHESIPTDLIFAIEASREQMPFPTVLELVIMILAFELIKEASTRVPEPIGSTLGIVGGLILGQAAVSANIASPLLIIIVSIAALGSFTAPTAAISRAITLLQLLFVLLGAAAGFLGIGFGVFSLLALMSSKKSFGVPYLKGSGGADSPFFVLPIWKREKRPAKLMPQALDKQPPVSRKWKGDDELF